MGSSDMIKSKILLIFILLIINSNIVSGKEPITPINVSELPQLSPQKIALGLRLFNEPLFAQKADMSCATCHPLSNATADGLALSLDNKGQPLTYNTPGLDYVFLYYYYTWTGKFSDLKSHLKALISNKRIFNSSLSQVADRLEKVQYLSAFKKAGYEKINGENIMDALLTFQQSLIAPSRFDLYLLGDKTQLSDAEIHGYLLFKDYGCISCHQGKNIGGNLRQTIGAKNNYFTEENLNAPSDLGYYNVTKDEYDKFSFRVPSLRNVAKTSPYFHNGSIKTLKKTIEVMAYYQLGVVLPEKDVLAIEVFLKTLNKIDE